MQPFEWISWEAAATLITGVLAVGAAWLVGKRQAGITQRQVEIAANQHSLERLKVRSDLFDRRFKVYEQSRTWVSYIVTHRRQPRYKKDQETEVAAGFADAWDISRFLFKPTVHAELERLRLAANALDDHHGEVVRQEMRKIAGAGEPDEAIIATHREAETAILHLFQTRLNDLSLIFGDELQLSDDAFTRQPYESHKDRPMLTDEPPALSVQ